MPTAAVSIAAALLDNIFSESFLYSIQIRRSLKKKSLYDLSYGDFFDDSAGKPDQFQCQMTVGFFSFDFLFLSCYIEENNTKMPITVRWNNGTAAIYSRTLGRYCSYGAGMQGWNDRPPYEYYVPCMEGMFQELYYWDSFFTAKSL